MSGSNLSIPKNETLFPKQNYSVLSPNFHIIHVLVSVSDLYIPMIGLPSQIRRPILGKTDGFLVQCMFINNKERANQQRLYFPRF
jgi:hypothetical protein